MLDDPFNEVFVCGIYRRMSAGKFSEAINNFSPDLSLARQ